MRPSPSFEIELTHFGLWRGGVVGLALLAAVVLVAWCRQAPGTALTGIGAALGAATIVAAGGLLRRAGPLRLRWDGQAWFAGAPGGEEHPAAMQLDVVVDLGVWMLLRLRPAAGVESHGARWVAAQRRGHEGQWHGMRCAVYFPRPTVGGPPGAEPQLPE